MVRPREANPSCRNEKAGGYKADQDLTLTNRINVFQAIPMVYQYDLQTLRRPGLPEWHYFDSLRLFGKKLRGHGGNKHGKCGGTLCENH